MNVPCLSPYIAKGEELPENQTPLYSQAQYQHLGGVDLEVPKGCSQHQKLLYQKVTICTLWMVNTIQYTDGVLQNCTLENYIIL